jgi:hypothetical protein
MNDLFQRMADQFEAKIRESRIGRAASVALVVEWVDPVGKTTTVSREPIDGTVQVSLGSPALDKPWAVDLRTVTLARNMRQRVLSLADNGHQGSIWDIRIEFVPAPGPPDY